MKFNKIKFFTTYTLSLIISIQTNIFDDIILILTIWGDILAS